jgi:hypothetical protein
MSLNYEVDLKKMNPAPQQFFRAEGVMIRPEHIAKDPDEHIGCLFETLHNELTEELFRVVLFTLLCYLEHKHQGPFQMKDLEEIYRSKKFKLFLDMQEEFPKSFEGLELEDKDRYVPIDFWEHVPLVLDLWGIISLKKDEVEGLANPFSLPNWALISPKLSELHRENLNLKNCYTEMYNAVNLR